MITQANYFLQYFICKHEILKNNYSVLLYKSFSVTKMNIFLVTDFNNNSY